MSLGGAATEDDGELVANLFGSVGKIWRANEKLFDAITGLRYNGCLIYVSGIDNYCRIWSPFALWNSNATDFDGLLLFFSLWFLGKINKPKGGPDISLINI